ncbi:amidohydrolase family protein [Demequina aurantiaca]|uniref:amidohydrolase family protein n=1 Tax=Demequina aurantiaca TaxID=676200 RepID=UPI003D353F8C
MTNSGEFPSLIRGAHLPDGSAVDVTISGGTVTSVLPSGTARVPSDASAILDLDGHLLLSATAEPHAHLDKAGSWDAIRPPMGDLRAAIVSWRDYADAMTEQDIVTRARAQVLRNVRNGTTAIRSHVDLLRGDDPLRGIRAINTVRDELHDLVDIEIISLVPADIPTSVVEASLDAGADGIGAAAHLAPEPFVELDRILAIAERNDCVLDMHTDESLDEVVTLGRLAERTRAWSRNVTAGHCVRLGTVSVEERDGLIEAVVASGIGVIANPITNLYLQGWEHEVATPRGLTAVRALVDAGARFAAGADNVRDPFNPMGRSDGLETAMLLVVAGHLTAEEAFHAVSGGAREVMGLASSGPTAGAAADLLAVRASHLTHAIAEASADRVVLHGGRVVARTQSHSEFPTLDTASVRTR